jgi:hypothetical protein
MANSLGIQENLTGFGEMGGDAVEQLRKALTAGSGANAGAFTGGRALIPESLEATLVNILFTQKDAVLFQSLKKKTIKSPVHQWDTRTEVGADDGAWVDEAGASIADANQTIQRVYATVKYLQTQRTVTLQATLADMIEPAMAIEQNAGALWICRNIEKALFYGNSAYVSEQIDGIESQLASSAPSNIIDMQGASANSSAFEDSMGIACRQIRDNYGRASLVLSSTIVMQDMQRLLRDRIRFPAGGGQPGTAVMDKYPTPFGEPDLKYDLFIKEGTNPAASTLTTNRPGAAPTAGGPSYPSDPLSLFTAANAGAYYYQVVPTNMYGDGPALALGPYTVAAGQSVTIPITVGGAPLPTAYKLYRSQLGAASGADCRYMFTTAYTGSPMNLVDDNLVLPGTSSAYVLCMEDLFDAIEWFQYLPLMKFDLYPTNSAVYPFLMLLFGALALKKPVQHMRIKNIAPDSLGWY